MKTTFKRSIDKFDESYIKDDSKIIKELDISIDNITDNVMKNISSSEKPRKKRKKLTFILIAAALTTAVVGTTVIAATLNKKETFSEVITGETEALDVYSADDFKFKTDDDNLDAEFTGLVGNEDTVYAAVELRHKDGSAFFAGYDDFYEPNFNKHLDKQYYSNYYQEFENYIAELFDEGTFTKNDGRYIAHDLGPDYYEGILEIRDKNNKDITDDTSCNVVYINNKETNTLKLYIQIRSHHDNVTDLDSSSSETLDLTDCRLTLRSNYFVLFNYEKELGKYSEPDDSLFYQDVINRKEKAENGATIQFENQAAENYSGKTKWKYENGSYSVYKVSNKKLDMPFEISFTLTQPSESNYLELELSDKNAPSSLKNNYGVKLSFTPFEVKIDTDDFRFDENAEKFIQQNIMPAYFNNEWVNDSFRNDDNALIVLKNGKEYGFHFCSGGVNYYFDEEEKKMVLNFDGSSSYYEIDGTTKEKINDDKKTTVIDPDNISKIIINGDTVYSAE